MADKLAEVEGSRKEQLVAVKPKLGTFRMKAQRLGKIYGNKAPPGSEVAGTSGIAPKKTVPSPRDSQSSQIGRIFKAPERFEDCRICKHLEQEGKSDLFDDHLSTFPTELL